MTDRELADLATKAAADIIRELVSCGVMEQPFGASMIGERHILAALRRAAGGQWVSVEDKLPREQQDVLFITAASNWEPFKYLDGRMLGGRYISGPAGGFAVPGIVFEATHWMPMPALPTKGE